MANIQLMVNRKTKRYRPIVRMAGQTFLCYSNNKKDIVDKHGRNY